MSMSAEDRRIAELEAVIIAAQWAGGEGVSDDTCFCPWCERLCREGHADECIVRTITDPQA